MTPQNKFYGDEFLQSIFDAIPGFVFIVDSDVKLLFWNATARQLVGEQSDRVYLKRGGEAIRCIHSTEAPEGCGTSAACERCVIRGAVAKALLDKKASRAFTRVQLCSGEKIDDIYLLVTASPFTHHNKVYALLILEDVSHVIALEEARSKEVGETAAAENAGLLTGKEREILRWLKKGKSTWDVSQILKISERTVNYHIYNIIQKLDAMNRTHAVAIALEKGLIHETET